MREAWREAFCKAPQHVRGVPLPSRPHCSSSHVPLTHSRCTNTHSLPERWGGL